MYSRGGWPLIMRRHARDYTADERQAIYKHFGQKAPRYQQLHHRTDR